MRYPEHHVLCLSLAAMIATSGIYVLYRERTNDDSELKGRGPYQSRYAMK